MLLFVPPLTYSQNNRLQFQHVTVAQGLSHPCVQEICQDSTGFMWFGGNSGVDRFDGREIRSIDMPTVHALCTDKRGDVWISNAIGNPNLLCISPSRDTILTYNVIGVRSIVCDTDSTLWIGGNDGLFHVDPKAGQLDHVGRDADFKLGITGIAIDGRGNLWILTRKSILRFEKSTCHITVVAKGTARVLTSIMVAPDGMIWTTGDSTSTVCFIDPTTLRREYLLEKGHPVPANCVAIDRTGMIYIGTQHSGLKTFDPKTRQWRTYHHLSSDPQSILDDVVNSIGFDNKGNLWIATAGGISWAAWRHDLFHAISVQGEESDPMPEEVRAVVEDEEGKCWLATVNGLRKWDREHETVTSISGVTGRINALAIVRRHQLWIATSGKQGLLRLDTRSKADKPTAKALISPLFKEEVISILQEGDTTLWFGCTRSTLYRYDLRSGHSWKFSYETPEQLNPGRVGFFGDDCPRMIYRDRKGVLWIATSYGILFLDEPAGRLTRFVASRNNNDWFWPSTICVYEDTKGRFWVGNDMGLDLFNRTKGTFSKIIHTPRRLQGRTVLGILEDRNGSLWLQTDGRILKYDHESGTIGEFGQEEGYPITYLATFFSLGNRAQCVTSKGDFILGIRNKIVLFDPNSFVKNTIPPVVAITGVKVLGEPNPQDKKLPSTFALPKQPLCFTADQHDIEFRFAGLDYAMPSQIQYVVWLEPADHNWSNLGTQNIVRFMNLSPGSYRLRVKAANSDSVWSSREASYRFEILPPWWRTLWFRVLIGLVCIGIIVTIIEVRLRHMLAQERLRVQIASDLHDDIGSSLSSIALVSENVRSELGENHPAQHSLRSMTSVAREAADKLKDDVWIIKPGSDTLENLLLRMKDVTQSSIGHMEYSFQNSMNGISRQVPMEFRRNMLLIYKEALHNILKHSGATNVEILIEFDDGTLILDVRDNGKGFDPKATHKGNGLVNLQRRADALKGDLLIDSAKNEGTHIHLKVKIP